MMADRWVPDFVMTRERYQSLYRTIYSRVDRNLRPTLKDGLLVLQAPLMGSADTSKARYVWLPFKWEGDMPRLKWRDEWKVK